MRTCKQNREKIVWLALESLEPEEAEFIRAHIAECQGCRNYLEEISATTQSLREVEPAGDIESSVLFHQRIVREVRESTPRSIGDFIWKFLKEPMTEWRTAVSVTAVIVVSLLFLATLLRRPTQAPHMASKALPSPATPIENGPGETVASPWIANGWSLEQIDAQLAREASQQRSVKPDYTAAMGIWSPAPE